MNPPGDGPGGNPDDHQGGQPPGPPPTGPVAVPNQFGNPDVPLEQLGYPSSDPGEAMPEISSESRPPDDPGQPPIGFPIDTDPVHPFVPSPDSNPPEPEPYVPENRERHSKHMRKLSVDSPDALPKAKVKFQVKRSKVQLPGHDEPVPAPPKSVPRSFFPGHSENPTASSSKSFNFPEGALQVFRVCGMSALSQESGSSVQRRGKIVGGSALSNRRPLVGISDNAFRYCKLLNSISAPGCRDFGYKAFAECCSSQWVYSGCMHRTGLQIGSAAKPSSGIVSFKDASTLLSFHPPVGQHCRPGPVSWCQAVLALGNHHTCSHEGFYNHWGACV